MADRHERNLADRASAFRAQVSGRGQPEVVAASPTLDKPNPGGRREKSRRNTKPDLRTRSPSGPGSRRSSPKGKGKGKPHGDKCYFYNLDIRGLLPKCNRSDCTRKHERVPDEAFGKMCRGSSAGSSKPQGSSRSGGFSLWQGPQEARAGKERPRKITGAESC